MDVRAGKPPPDGYDHARPWDYRVCGLGEGRNISGRAKCTPQHLTWIAHGSHGMPRTPAEQLASSFDARGHGRYSSAHGERHQHEGGQSVEIGKGEEEIHGGKVENDGESQESSKGQKRRLKRRRKRETKPEMLRLEQWYIPLWRAAARCQMPGQSADVFTGARSATHRVIRAGRAPRRSRR